MKRLHAFLLALLLLLGRAARVQSVGIGTATPDALRQPVQPFQQRRRQDRAAAEAQAAGFAQRLRALEAAGAPAGTGH